MGHARLASGGQAPPSGQLLRSGPMPVAAGGQVKHRTLTGQSFQGSRPPLPVTARIITEPPGSLTVIPPAATRPHGAHWLDTTSDLSCKDSTGQYAVDDPPLSCQQQVPVRAPVSAPARSLAGAGCGTAEATKTGGQHLGQQLGVVTVGV
jgi:hypothetical protein